MHYKLSLAIESIYTFTHLERYNQSFSIELDSFVEQRAHLSIVILLDIYLTGSKSFIK